MNGSLRAASGLIALLALSAEASAQNLDAGKSPQQLFAGNCAACHRSAKGLAKSNNTGQVAGFLRQHYTSSREMAGTLAAYVVGSGVDPSGRGARAAAQDPGKPDPRRDRQAARTPEAATPDAAQAKPQTAEERAAARRAAKEAAEKKQEALERSRVGLNAGGDPSPVQISSQPVPLAHDRASSRADTTRTYTPPKSSQAAAVPASAPEKPAAAKPTPAVTAALPSAPPEVAQSGATSSGTMATQKENPAAETAGPSVETAPSAAPTETQPFAAPLP
ncbi:hypothetical protein [Variibacter gotjawalensis]|uniref:hypothetical protein n=1 Tax=Variibacter gotjawalensis TaxID=1333996 RepID=UPI000BBA60FD|nr:hypothetical protein [Variibacter gotjawalensis]NIK46379.1 mono/diheme cytochrome c family protein [Variibacter gotjawalensis]